MSRKRAAPRGPWVDELEWIYLHGPREVAKIHPKTLEKIESIELMVDRLTMDGQAFVDLNEHGRYFMGEPWSEEAQHARADTAADPDVA